MNNKHELCLESSLSAGEQVKPILANETCSHCGAKKQRTIKRIDLGVGLHKEYDSQGLIFAFGQKYSYEFCYACESCSAERQHKIK